MSFTLRPLSRLDASRFDAASLDAHPLERADASALRGLRPIPNTGPNKGPSTGDMFGVALLRAGRIPAAFLLQALRQPQTHLVEHLMAKGVMDETAAYNALAAHWALGLADFQRHPIDPALIERTDAAACLAEHWVPWHRLGGATVIVCAYPDDFAALRPRLRQTFGEVVMAIAPRRLIEAQIIARAGAMLARRAETLLPLPDSCRSFSPRNAYGLLLVVLGGLALGAALAPMATLYGVIGFAVALAHGLAALKLLATGASLRRQAARGRLSPLGPAEGVTGEVTGAQNPHLQLVRGDGDLPRMSIMVPLFRESRIVARLVRRLEQLDYPRRALEVIFLTEDNDEATATALASIALPEWLRVLAVPTGTIRTKPRALNYGLDHCTGKIIGVYDAEDAPEADQLRKVAAGFAAGGPQLACLQGRLDYYNPRKNWLSRCFTMEYEVWWRVVLEGFSRLGFAIPLGGTTLFFRRDILVQLGGWDAHNVTEDADLGLRLARRGFETQLFDSTTYEEANCRTLPWIKQRSRWIKGYMMTYAAHMRRPRQILADLGPWRFFGMQMMFAGSVLQALLLPLLIALWFAPFGHGASGAMAQAPALLNIVIVMGLMNEVFSMAITYLGLRRAGQAIHPMWVFLMPFYNLLASVAAYKALYEVLTKPFYWDKTAHGLFDT